MTYDGQRQVALKPIPVWLRQRCSQLVKPLVERFPIRKAVLIRCSDVYIHDNARLFVVLMGPGRMNAELVDSEATFRCLRLCQFTNASEQSLTPRDPVDGFGAY